MASTLTAPIGAALGPAGAFIFGLAGAALDGIVMPHLFGEDNNPPELGSAGVNYGDEGAGAIKAYGAHNRITPSIILASKPWAVQAGSTSLGKRAEQVQWTHLRDVIYLGTWNRLFGGVESIVMDGEVVYVANPNRSATLTFALQQQFITFLGPTVSVQVWELTSPGLPGNGWSLVQWHWKIENHPSNGVGGVPLAFPELGNFLKGQRVAITYKDAGGGKVLPPQLPNGNGQFRNPENFTVLESRVVGYQTVAGQQVPRTRLVLDLHDYIDYRNTQAIAGGFASPFRNAPTAGPVAVADFPFVPWPGPTGYTVEIVQTGETWQPNVVNTQRAYFYNAEPQAQPDPNYQRRLGIEGTPGLPGKQMVSLGEVNVSRRSHTPALVLFVNQVSQVQGLDLTLSQMLTLVLSQEGTLPQAFLNFLRLTSDPDALGVNWRGPVPTARIGGHLLLQHDTYLATHSGQLHFISRAARVQVPVDVRHLTARRFNDPPSDPIDVRSRDPRTRPRNVHVKYLDADNDLQNGDVHWPDPRPGVSSATKTLNLPLAMRSFDAKKLALRTRMDMDNLRDEGTARLPFWYLGITPTDILMMDGAVVHGGARPAGSGGEKLEDESLYFSVRQTDVGPQMMVGLVGEVLEDLPATIPDPESVARGGTYRGEQDAGAIAGTAMAVPVILDLPALRDEDATRHGIYAGVGSPHTAVGTGYMLMRSVGGGTVYASLGPVRPLVLGVARTPLHVVSDAGLVDYSHDLVVELVEDELAEGQLGTVTDDDLNAGANMGAVRAQDGRWKVIQWKEAVLETSDTSGPRYRLRGIIHGLYGSDDLQTTEGSWFVVLDRDALTFVPLPLDSAGTEMKFHAVPAGMTPSEVPAAIAAPSLRSSLPLRVANLRAERLGDGAVRFTFQRRPRGRYRALGTQAPLFESVQEYEIRIDPDGVNRPIRLLPAAIADSGGDPAATYAAAWQADDGLDGLGFAATVYAIDQVRGRGEPATIQVPAPQATRATLAGDTRVTLAGDTRVTRQ